MVVLGGGRFLMSEEKHERQYEQHLHSASIGADLQGHL